MAKPDQPEHYGVFVKDGMERVAGTPADAVAARFDGWTEKTPATAKAADAPATETGGGDVAGDSSTKTSTRSNK